MRIPTFTIKGLLIAVAVIAVDCYLVVEVFFGVFLPAIGLNVGLVRILRREARGRLFWIAFEVTGILALVIYAWLLTSMEDLVSDWPTIVLNFLFDRLPAAAEASLVPTLEGSDLGMICIFVIIYEATVGLPLLLFAAFGGWLAMRALPGPVARPGPVEDLALMSGPGAP